MLSSFVIGIAGGSGSGKTTLGRALHNLFGVHRSDLIYQDSYYLDQSDRFDHDGGQVNFDHPESLEFSLLAKHLADLKIGRSVQIPIYDFKTHKRLPETQNLEPREIILVDGILILSQPEVVRELNFSIYVDTPEDLRYSRRLRRDVLERGRTEEGVRAQFYKQVKPMHDLFVEPSKKFANLIVSGTESVKVLESQILNELKVFLDL